MSNPYGPYPGDPYGGRPAGPQGIDGISIASLVLSILCCGPVGVILGVIGLGRTKDNQRSGRWAAICGIVLGSIATLVIATGVVVALVAGGLGFGTLDAADAEAGQCADKSLESDDGDNFNLTEADCDTDHDVEIVWAGQWDDVVSAAEDAGVPASASESELGYQGCAALAQDDYADVENPADYEIGVWVQDGSPSGSEDVLCLVQRTDGEQLDAPLS